MILFIYIFVIFKQKTIVTINPYQMISVDRVYKTVLTLANSDIRGNVTPSELKLVLNDVVNEVYEGL
jgi:hypothetical protein